MKDMHLADLHKRARDLVTAFPNVFEVLEREPDKLLGVKGFGKAALQKLLEHWMIPCTGELPSNGPGHAATHLA